MARDAHLPILASFERHFSVRLPFTRFARNTVVLSLIGMMPVLALYIVLAPGFWPQLIAGDAALARFMRQILTNGVPVVFVVNALGLVLFAQLRADRLRPAIALAIDMAARIGVFAALHVAIYPASALMFGSFGGDPAQALRVVGPSLAHAAAFGNLSGVYLYATLVSALPLHMALIEAAQQGRGSQATGMVVFGALAVFASQVLLLTALARVLAVAF